MLYKSKLEYATFKDKKPSDYSLSKAITKHTNRKEFGYYCEFFNLDVDTEKKQVQKRLTCKFSW